MQLCVHPNQRNEPLVLPWLLDEVACPALDAFHREIDVPPGRHHDNRQARIDLLETREEVKALLPGGGVPRVVQVNEKDVVIALPQRFQQQLGRAHALHVDALRLKQQFNCFEDVWLIVGN